MILSRLVLCIDEFVSKTPYPRPGKLSDNKKRDKFFDTNTSSKRDETKYRDSLKPRTTLNR